MHDGYLDARPVRVPVLVRQHLGSGWATLHELAALRGRRPPQQVLALILFALWYAQQGGDTELTGGQLNELLETLETVA
jgi:hypothetical protein